MTFSADKVKIRGPQADGSYKITFTTGEYERENVAKLMNSSQVGTAFKVKVEVVGSEIEKENETEGNDLSQVYHYFEQIANIEDQDKEKIKEEWKEKLSIDSLSDLSEDDIKHLERNLKAVAEKDVTNEAKDILGN